MFSQSYVQMHARDAILFTSSCKKNGYIAGVGG